MFALPKRVPSKGGFDGDGLVHSSLADFNVNQQVSHIRSNKKHYFGTVKFR